ncbi:MAG: outer membrane lipoprotein chaperone LolA [Gammaproteobacteria bacterium]|nr:outer membrane lipoprotein chaperone LolA [Gammaproteobacteria bacterium]
MPSILHPGLLLVLLALCGNLWAAAGPEQMRRFLQEVKGLEARFEQTLLNTQNQQEVKTRGAFYLNRPNQFRWDYLEPEKQQLIADGRQIWLYDSDLDQVSVQSQDSALKGTPAMLLISGEQKVDETFKVYDQGSRESLDWVKLLPRDEESQFVRILLAFDEGELRRMEMVDKFGQMTRFRFYDVHLNPEFSSDFFHFEPPLNADLYSR